MRYPLPVLSWLLLGFLTACNHVPEPLYTGPYNRFEAQVMAEKIGVVEDARVVNYLPISDSMWPILDQNVWIIIKHMPERLTEGQIVAVGEYGKPFRIHRLEHVDHHKHLLYLKGVNNLYGDDPVPMRLYQGTLIGIVPYATL